MRILPQSLYLQVLIAVTIGVIFAHFYPEIAVNFKPFGDGFIKLIKMVIGPLIFCTIVLGIVTMEDIGTMGRIGIKTLFYFEILTTFALIIGLVVGNLIKPGIGMNIDASTLDSSSLQSYTGHIADNNIVNFLLNIIPQTFTSAFSQGAILPILFISVLFGFALHSVKEKAESVITLIEQLLQILFKIINFIMKLAPIGAFGAMSYTVAKYGVSSLLSLGFLIVTFYITCSIFVFVILGFITKLCGINIWNLLKYIKDEFFLVLGTSSSESALPSLMRKLENIGCPKSIVGITIPSGYSFNLDGTCIYFTLAIVFIANATGIELTIWQELYIILILLVTSKGAAGVTGSGFIALAATLSIIDTVPIAGLTLILGIDRFMSEARALTNLVGNTVATIAITKWEGKLDHNKANKLL
ncbi:MAG: C4-dicarboxylate transporter DctA [Proteobacteria bacterium]|nr:C4-dicarboxylate transporter DctA [Pseudomonadota bacterium]